LFNVRRVHVHIPFGSDGEDNAHGAEFDNWGERLRVDDSCSLAESLSNQPCLETVDLAMRFGLHLQGPLIANGDTSEWHIFHAERALTLK
jgi:hypothetical protein